MTRSRVFARAVVCLVLLPVATTAAREWTDAAGRYTLQADVMASNDEPVVLKRADRELVALPITELFRR